MVDDGWRSAQQKDPISSFTDVFENLGHQETFCPQSLVSKRASTPVTSNSLSTGPLSPCKQNIARWWRAILRVSTEVALPRRLNVGDTCQIHCDHARR